MKNNPFAYVLSGLFVLLAHLAMLANIMYNGNYAQLSDVWTLAGTVLGLDLAWFIIMPFFRQHSHTVDFILILILNMSLIFQSCFGEVHLARIFPLPGPQLDRQAEKIRLDRHRRGHDHHSAIYRKPQYVDQLRLIHDPAL